MRFPRPWIHIVTAIAWFGAVPFAHATSGDSAAFLLDTRNYEDSTPLFSVDTVAPDVLANTGILDPGGTAFTLTMAMLQVTGGPLGTDAITFTLLRAPVHGSLYRDGVALGAGAMFTQADVDAGLLSYERPAGVALADTFELGAVDAAARGLVEGSFYFSVAGVPGASGVLFLVDTRNGTNSPEHAVHTDKRAYLAADTVPGSLRQAIANTESSGTTTLDAALSGATIVLESGPLVVDRPLTLDQSATPGGLTLSGNQNSVVLHLTPTGVFALDGMTLRDGKSTNFGGAIVNEGDLLLTNVTVTNSFSYLDGGGIFNTGTLFLGNTTIAGNLAGDYGGGIFNAGALTAIHTTITDNDAFFLGGGGIYNNGGTVALENSIVAGNFAGQDDNLNGPPTSATGYNLLSGNPRLAPVGNYGGLSPTAPPLPGSPAIEGALLLGSTPPLDQHGNPRPRGPLPDLGAVEAGSLLLGMFADTDNDEIPDVMEGLNGPYPHLTLGVDDRGVDTDGDGSTDAEEISNMTDLNDAGDYFRVLGFALAPGFDPLTNPLVSITFSSFPGLAYEAETDNALGTFEPVTGSLLTADDFTETVEVLLEPGAKSFARVRRR